tara:strand:+ start:512 stop:1573 length:1062 start_codon:yes stop_codon:yes gene_type:complete
VKHLIYFIFISIALLSCSQGDVKTLQDGPKSEISDGYLPSLNETIELVSPSVVAINTSTVALDRFFIPRVRSADGSGVIISKDGYIITNDHVISDAREISVFLNDGQNFTAEIIGRVPYSDIALLKINTDFDLTPISTSKSENLKVGDWVIAIGNAFGLVGTPTVTVGIVSAKERVMVTEDDRTLTDMIQTDAAINEGNSGGPLVNLKGELVGINSTIMRGAEGIGFAISSDLVQRYIDDLLEFGVVQIPKDGIEARTIDSNLLSTLCEYGYNVCDLDENLKGIVVLEIEDGGISEKSGIIPGDIILSINDKPIRTNGEYISWMYNYRPGEEIKLNVLRDNQDLEIFIKLGKY